MSSQSLNNKKSVSFSTYEATKASELADPIHWSDTTSFRNCPYRLLHHQQGICGIFQCRLLEASNLQRCYWSALAIGPVKHLGLSKAHGQVSSFCTFSLQFRDTNINDDDNNNNNNNDDNKKRPSVISPVIENNNNPVWDNCQFEFPLRKGVCKDGQRICLEIRVNEEGTPVESFLPSNRLLGIGTLDLTELCIGESIITGQTLPGIKDVWVDIYMPEEEQRKQEDEMMMYNSNALLDPLAQPPSKSITKKFTGKVRLLVSYNPNGYDPQPRDIVAMESFARQNVIKSSCRPILDPLQPFTVLDRRGLYLLCEYWLPNHTTKACVRLHRNAVFVIERQNLVDAAHNLALLPIDVALSTPIGQTAQRFLTPVVHAGTELAMPALLSFKLLWMAARTTSIGVLSGVTALGGTLWHEGSTSLTGGGGGNNNNHHHNDHNHQRRTNQSSNAKFVQL